jgi:hypothetical protein
MSIRAAILAALVDGPMTNAELRVATGVVPDSISAACCFLRQKGRIVSSIGGSGHHARYALPEHAEQLGPTFLPAALAPIEPEPPRVDRDPCPYCATRRDYGCRHFPLEQVAA